jgi:hypothetical protein
MSISFCRRRISKCVVKDSGEKKISLFKQHTCKKPSTATCKRQLKNWNHHRTDTEDHIKQYWNRRKNWNRTRPTKWQELYNTRRTSEVKWGKNPNYHTPIHSANLDLLLTNTLWAIWDPKCAKTPYYIVRFKTSAWRWLYKSKHIAVTNTPI